MARRALGCNLPRASLPHAEGRRVNPSRLMARCAVQVNGFDSATALGIPSLRLWNDYHFCRSYFSQPIRHFSDSGQGLQGEFLHLRHVRQHRCRHREGRGPVGGWIYSMAHTFGSRNGSLCGLESPPFPPNSLVGGSVLPTPRVMFDTPCTAWCLGLKNMLEVDKRRAP